MEQWNMEHAYTYRTLFHGVRMYCSAIVPTRSNSNATAKNKGVKSNSCSKACSISVLVRVEQPLKDSETLFHSERGPKSREKQDKVRAGGTRLSSPEQGQID